ncbi:hypothetical protein [Streptomyces fructofermentans]|uniref:Uncharacterized protein n=1 Tax=Streptomyces fructofermentans TaxID=152141 RepID=A0A918KPW6_9ACTN|nr:hypothetical protein [Streptomyces fructofermentans]GGX70226.1 hypothetical protein GCM10010515_42420 [Streptomyces fructofermentans]
MTGLQRRISGTDHDAPHPGPLPDRRYAALAGGPPKGRLPDVAGWTARQIGASAALKTDLGRFGPDGRTLCEPRSGDPLRFD